MGFNCGIVGLPNVGKSTLFNALTATQAAQAANYPFCTIEPNVGRVAVPDPRLDRLAAIASSAKIINTQLEFVDIAGLVKGASKGEGLGNQFLANIREVDAIAHVLRCFEDSDVTHVSGSVDPVRDAEIVETELMLADLDSLEKRLPNLEKRAKGGDKEAAAEAPVVKKALDALREGKPAREAAITAEERPVFRLLQLITAKPMMYVLNVDEASAATGNAHSAKAEAYARTRGMPAVVISAAIEAEVAQLPPEDQARISRPSRPQGDRSRASRAGGLPAARSGDLLHRRPEGGARLDGAPRGHGAGGGRRHPHRFREGLHPRRDHRLRRLRHAERRSGRTRCRQAPARGQGLSRQGRRRLPLPLQRLIHTDTHVPLPLGRGA